MTQETAYDTALALIGLSGRFPGARSVEAFWQNIAGGVKSIRRFSDEELLAAGIDPALLHRPNYVKAGTVIEDIDRFDAAFFGFTPREAEIMDPQHRLFLECAWEALESAAYDPRSYRGLIGVFAGSAFSTYLLNNLYPNTEMLELLGQLQIDVGNDRDSLASMVSYKLNLRGPSIAVQTFCSTSLVAAHLACQSLINYECDIALAGGVAIILPQQNGYLYEEGGILSPDGECCTFDARGQGSVMGNGLGVVALKRYAEAVQDGDHIYAVIRGSAVNNDGSTRVSYTAPGLDGQAGVITGALSYAGVDAETISYLEAHGTGTRLGDAVELAAMIKAFSAKTRKKQFCAIGSVKPNVGHLDRAAGVTGLIKTALALHQKQLPPSLNFDRANSDLDLGNSPFYVNTSLREWPTNADGEPRRAGVSSFGLGGTNAHVVLEEAPEHEPASPSRPWQLLLLSARTETALQAAAANLETHLKTHATISLPDVAYTLQVGRAAFNHRRVVLCRDRQDALHVLEQNVAGRVWTAEQSRRDRPVAFLFPGVGEQYAGLARELYQQEPTFRETVEQCCTFLKTRFGLDLREVLFAADQRASSSDVQNGLNLRALLGRSETAASTADERLKQTALAQPALFIIEYALAQLLIAWGIRPSVMIGYSLGEYVAACCSGVLSLEDALTLVTRRAQLIQEMTPGAMLAVALAEADVQPYLDEQISLACINAPLTCVLSGPVAAIERLQERLNEQDIACRRVETTHAFHSQMLEPLREQLTDLARGLTFNAPQIPYISNVTGTWITAEQATDTAYWARHMCQTVRFADGAGQLLQQGEYVLLEIGPGQSLGSFVRQHPSCGREGMARVFSTLPSAAEGRSDMETLLTALGRLWLAGVAIEWRGFYAGERRYRLPLPTYPFERQRYWIDPPQKQTSPRRQEDSFKGKKADIADWFYVPMWQQVALPSPSSDNAATQSPWLIFEDNEGLGQQVARRLLQEGHTVVRVQAGAQFARLEDNLFTLQADESADYLALLESLTSAGQQPGTIVHCWSLTPEDAAKSSIERFKAMQEAGFYSLLSLTKALGASMSEHTVRLLVVSNAMQIVTDQDQALPEKATLLGACKVIAQENMNIFCRSIDISTIDDRSDVQLVDLLIEELSSGASDPAVAYRAGQRWVQKLEARRIEASAPGTSKLRERGVYLITGGLGGVGPVLAAYLAETARARIVLVGRSALPERDEWEAWLQSHDDADRISRKIRQVQDIEARGGEVLLLSADVADEAQMRAVIQQIYARFGALHGVIHAAGISDEKAFGLAQQIERETCEWHFQPKVYGTYTLEKVLEGHTLDFCVLFSSLSSVLGGLGFAAYAAANLFMDAFVQRHNRSAALPWISVNWDTWQVKELTQGTLGSTVAEYAMTLAEGTEVLARVLASNGLAQAVISTGDLQARIRQWVLLESLRESDADEASDEDALSTFIAAPERADYERRLTEIWRQVLGIEQVGSNDNFFDLGGNSLIALQVVSKIRKVFRVQIPVVALFEAPTISAMAAYLQPAAAPAPQEHRQALAARREQARHGAPSQEIAIIGLAGRFPGASNVEQFWHNLRNGVESISFFSDDELIAAGVDPALLRDPNYVRARPVLDDVEHFDAAFFGYSPREAELMDPQHRLFLESCWQALEDAAYDPSSYEGLIGVFGGANVSTYLHALISERERVEAKVGMIDGYQIAIGTDKDSLTTSVSYKLNLRGPSYAVQTFCSTSLVAVHLACQSLRQGECDMALAGGVSVRVPTVGGHLYQQGGMESPDGHVRTFDAEARGSMFGDGVGVVVLKRLADALADGDQIAAVIKGSALNNDGSLKVSYTAPSVAGQAEVVRSALAQAGVTAESISYVEAHGTATELGDPIEVAALTKAYREQTEKTGYCAIGSVKTNVGHLDRAAGVSGLIKTVLALKHEELPPSLHYHAPNPQIDFENSPFYVNAKLALWPRGERVRRAGLNSLGMGGTNVHLILEEAPVVAETSESRSWQLLLLSAKTRTALEVRTSQLRAYLQEHESSNLADVAYTLQVGRARMAYRHAVLCRDREEAIAALAASDVKADGRVDQTPVRQVQRNCSVAFLFPDVGERYVGMARELYQAEEVFRNSADRCFAFLKTKFGLDVRGVLYPEGLSSTASDSLGRTTLPQPAVFIVEYALAQLLMQWGVRPAAMLGHGLGEYVAACLSGVLSLEDALTLVTRRAQLMQDMPSALDDEALESLREPLTELVRGVRLHEPRIPYISNVTGTWITIEQATDPDYWTRYMYQTARLSDGIAELLREPERLLLEVGPGQSLSSLARQHSACGDERAADIFTTLPSRGDQQASLLTTLGKLWVAGVTVDWSGFSASERRRRVSLPAYPFERQRYWLPSVTRLLEPRSSASVTIARKPDIADWFYQPIWEQSALATTKPSLLLNRPFLVFVDTRGIGEQAARRLEQAGHTVMRIQAGEQFARLDDRRFSIRPDHSADYIAFYKALQEMGTLPGTILHCWSLSQGNAAGREYFRACQEEGFYSLLFLAQALGAQYDDVPVQILAVSNAVQAVTGAELLRPEKATMLGASTVITQEHPNILCRSIDFAAAEMEGSNDEAVVDALIAECTRAAFDPVVAYRDRQRWIQTYQAARLPEAAQTPFRRHGVYLITGGLGGIGLTLAEYLAKTAQAKLVLIGRTGLPARDEWSNWLSSHEAGDRVSEAIWRIQAIEEQGGEALALVADVADEAQMRAAIQQALETFGAIHGVFHAAGITSGPAFQTIPDIGRAECETHFHAKVHGTFALEQALADLPLDFCLLFSSLSSVLGGLGFVGYAAGNIFLDAFARKHNQTASVPWMSVNWDTWQVKEDAHGVLGASIAAFSMQPEEAIEALLRVLASGELRLVNSTGDLHARLRQWMRLEALRESGGAELAAQIAAAAASVSAVPMIASGDYEQTITEIWKQVLGLEHVGLYENFFDLGGNSLIGLQLIARLKKAFHVQIPAVILFEAPTISAQVKYLQPVSEPVEVEQDSLPRPQVLAQRRAQARKAIDQQGVAIIGLSGRFPGAVSIAQFWQNLRNGVESISFFSEEEMLAAGVDPRDLQAPNYVRARPILENIDQFDAAFFGYSPREAEITDPQHRLFLECAWEALEDAAYDARTYEGLIGVFGGTNISTYILSLLNDPQALGLVNPYQLLAGNDKDSLTSSVSYKLNLRGPSFAVQTFCSTSLVATHLACQSLLNGECDIALAGGSSVRVPSKEGYLYEEGGMESPDGHVRTFDAQAGGSMFGDGVGVVVLKRLDDAIADGDHIYAVVKGSAINNDGSLKVSYAAPSVAGQAEVVASALAQANVLAESISYVEAHGTATKLGDPIEMASLTRAYRTQTEKTGYCAIGSVKTNVGHLDRAAGISGLIKTVLALKHEEIPPSLHYQRPNPEIDFEHSPFYVNTQLSSWKRGDKPRRAGVNSLGMGGTNAHVVLEEAPKQEPSGPSRSWQLVLLSARTESALDSIAANLSAYLQEHEESTLPDVAYTLQIGRRRFEYRRMLLCRTQEEALRLLAGGQGGIVGAGAVVMGGGGLGGRPSLPSLSWQSGSRVEQREDRPVVFLFPGLGEQFVGMAQELYRQEASFRATVDRCFAFLQARLGLDVRGVLYPETDAQAPSNGNGHANGKPAQATLNLRALLERDGRSPSPEHEQLKQTALAQPAVFIIEYALARLLMQWGIRPAAMLGYSLGEYVAACLSGVLSLEDALTLVARRAQLIQELPRGAMLAVALPESGVQRYLNEEINLAVINGPNMCVLAGPPQAIERLEAHLTGEDIAHRRVDTTHAFHSRMLEPARAALTDLARTVSLRAPQIPYISNVTGTWITAEQATDPAYWARHMCQTVRFAEGVGQLLQEAEHLLLEVGSGQSLCSFVKQHPACGRERMALVLPTLPSLYERQPADAYLLAALGKLWLAGVAIDWSGFSADEQRQRLSLPTYPFERQRYWLEASRRVVHGSAQEAGTADQLERIPDIANWFYAPAWKQAFRQNPFAWDELTESRCWLVLIDNCGVGSQVVSALRQHGQQVVTVMPGASFIRHDDSLYTVRPGQRADYEQVLQDLRGLGKLLAGVVHLWTITQPTDEPGMLDEMLDTGFYSLLALAQALGDLELETCTITIVSNGVQEVTGGEWLFPEKATLIGPCRVIPQEYANLHCRSIDLCLPGPGHVLAGEMLDQLVEELACEPTDAVVALRGSRRWVQAFEPVKLESREHLTPCLREGGVYLITGGLGGIGLAMAQYLARTVQARLVLTSRSGLPPRSEWPCILEARGSEEGVGRQIRIVQELEAAGTKALVLAADVTNEAQMRRVVQQAMEAFGHIDGALHTAGVAGIGLMQLKTPEQAARVLAPKVQGTLVLERVLEGQPLDFLVLFSSITSSTGGGPGQVDYCAANAFLDAYAHRHSSRHGMTIAIDWSEWQWNAWEAGLTGYGSEAEAFFKQSRQQFGISFEEGAEAFKRILSCRLPRVVVSTQDFRAIVEQSKLFTASLVLQRTRESRQGRDMHPRPTLSSSYAEPRSELERKIAAIWEDILGVSPVGINDNFFDLGGNSLTGIDLMTRMRKSLKIQALASYVLYEAPSVSAMARYIEQEQGKTDSSVAGRHERGERRRESLKQLARETRRTR
jgi:acyl transferase domain-containing protein